MEEDDDHSDEESDSAGSEVEDYADVGDGEEWNGDDADEFPAENEPNGVVDELDADFESSERVEQAIEDGWHRIESSAFGGMLVGGNSSGNNRPPSRLDASAAAEALLSSMLQGGHISDEAIQQLEGSLGFRIMGSLSRAGQGENGFAARVLGNPHGSSSTDQVRRNEAIGTVPHIHQRAQPEVGYSLLSGSSRMAETSAMEFVFGGPSVTGCTRYYDIISSSDARPDGEPQHHLTQLDLQLFPGGPAAVSGSGTQHSLHPLLCGIDLPPMSALVSDLPPHEVRVTRLGQVTTRRPGEVASTALSYGGYLFSTSSGGIIRSSRPNAGAPLANSGLTARHLAAPVGWTDDGLPVDSSVEVFTSAFERAVSATAFVPAPNSTSQVERSEAQVDSNAITNESQQNVTSSDASRNDVSMGEQVESNVNDSAESNQLSSDGVASSLAHGLRLSPGSDPGVSSDALEAIPMIQESMPTVNNPISGESAAVENGDALRGEDAGLSVSSEVVGISEIGTSRDENTSSDDPESGTTGETNANGLVCPPDVDPEVFNSLPFEMQQDCVLQYNSTLELAAQLNGSSLDPEFLAALPEEMRREVIEQDRRDRQLRQEAETQADPSNAQEMDNASFVASLSPELREEILVTADEAFLSSLPPDIVAEAQILRERASSQHRRLYDEGSGSRDNGGIADDGVASSSRHHAAQSAGSRSGGASKRKTRAGKIRIDCVRDELIYRPSSIPPVVGKSDVMLLVRLLYVMSPIRPPRLLQKIFHNLLGVRALRSVCSSLFVYLLHDKRELALAAVESLTAAYGVSDGWRRLMDQLFSPSDFPPSSTIGSTPAVSESDLSLGFIPGRRNQGNDTAAAIVASSNAGSSHYALPPAVCLRLVELLHQLCKNSSRFCYHLLVDQTFQIDSSTEGDTSFELLLDLLELPVFSTSASNMEHLLSVLESAVLSLSYIPKSGEDDAELSQKDIEAAKVAGKEWVEVPKVIVSQSRLQNLCSMLRSENIRDSSFTKINSIVRRLCRVESNRGYVLAELATVAGALGGDAVADLRALKVRLDQAAEHTKQGSDLSVESQPNDDTTRSPTPSHRLSSAIALSTSSSELKLLRVLQTLQALCLENWQDSGSKKSEGSIIVTEELVHLLRKLDFTQLWSELSSCLTVVQVLEGIKVLESRDHDNDSDDADESNDVDGREQNSKLRNSAAGLLTRFIPAIEAFFVANASATRRPESYDEPLPGKAEDVPLENLVGGQRLLSFVATNRVLLNALVRNNSGLLEKGFRALVQVPRCRVFLDFDVKQHWFKSQMRRLRLHASRRHGSLRLSVRRKHVFEEAYHQLRLRNADEIRGRLHITFRNEEGVDAGGLSREFFGILAKEIFNRNYALFTSTEDGCTFQPNQNSSINPDHLSYFRFVGRIVGKAVSDGFLLDAHFTRSLYKHMLGMRPTYHDMEAIDPDYYRNLKTILEYNLSDLGLDLNFSIEDHSFGRSQTIDLITNGRSVPVTEENKEEYVRLVCQHRMTTAIQAQIKAYLDGFYELVPPELISIFTPRELELLISGLPDIDVHDLKQNTEYVGWKATDKEIEWFWNVLTSLTRGEKASFLQFATGSSKVPLAGFGELQGMRGVQKFSIHRASGRAGALMSAHTCFNQLDLPRYASEEETREKLLYAINEGGGAFLFA
jgi:E3 ubiquitin-protein ligase HUWE1